MGRKKNSGSRIFLAELMIDILFFVVAAAICLSVFTRAYKMSADSREKNQAVIFGSFFPDEAKVGSISFH